MKNLALLSAALLLGGCAATDPNDAPMVDKQYTTGSNLPRPYRGDARELTPQEMEAMRDAGRANTGRRPGT